MNKKIFAILALCTASFNSAAIQSELEERDWRVPNDGLITYDSRTGLEWLDLTVTYTQTPKDSTMNVYKRTLETSHPDYDAIFGNDLLGWRIATKDEVKGLFSSAFPNAPTPFMYWNNTTDMNTEVFQNIASFTSLFGGTFYTSGRPNLARGVYCNSTINSQWDDFTCFVNGVKASHVTGTEYEGFPWHNNNNTVPTFLVRGEAIPEPDTCPAVTTEMTRQQAIDYISHLANQLSDPNAAVITPLPL